MSKYTQEEFTEFTRLVELLESCNNLDRIEGRIYMPKFVETHGKEKCDLMFKELE